jgi:hypothetical protein
MKTAAASFSENPDSTDDLVRDLEDSGYPVDGATEQFVPQPDGLALESEKPGFPPVQPELRTKRLPQAETGARAVATSTTKAALQTSPERVIHSGGLPICR